MKTITAIIVSGSLLLGISTAQAGGALDEIEVTGQQGASARKVATVWQPKPVYPKMALRRGLTGNVVVEYDINTEGRAENIVILESSPRGFFNNATVRIVKNSIFARSFDNGQATVASGIQRRYVYEIVRDEQNGEQLALSVR